MADRNDAVIQRFLYGENSLQPCNELLLSLKAVRADSKIYVSNFWNRNFKI